MASAHDRIPCSDCGAVGTRGEMFGVEPDLVCERCAAGIRERMQIRIRPSGILGRPVVTIAIIAICAVLFVAEHLIPYPQKPGWLINVLYLHLHMGPWIWSGDVSPFLSTVFMHGGWIHILFNMWWCWDLGRATEWGFGRLPLILIVIGCGMFAGAIEWMISGPAAGFSGVIYGLAFFLYAHRKTNPLAAAAMNQRTINYLGIWFVLCIVLTVSGTWSVGNWAHGAGAVWGYLVGLASLDRRRKLLVPIAALITAAVVGLSPFLVFGDQVRLRKADIQLQERDASRLTRVRVYNELWMEDR